MDMHQAAREGDLEALRERIERGDNVDERNGVGRTPLMYACNSGRLECAQALIEAGAAVDMVDNDGRTALMIASCNGHHECAQALIDAHADLELTNRDGQNALMIACQSPPSYLTQSQCQGKIRCALAILAATASIREVVVADQAASLKLACERHQVLKVVLSTSHIIEFAPAALARASVHVSDVHSIIVDFARDMLVQLQLANLNLDGLAIVGDSSPSDVRAPIEANYSY